MYTEDTLPPRSVRGWRNTVGTWLSLVERTLGVGEVASSNLVVPTNTFPANSMDSAEPWFRLSCVDVPSLVGASTLDRLQDQHGTSLNKASTGSTWMNRCADISMGGSEQVQPSWIGVITDQSTGPGSWGIWYGDMSITSTNGTVTQVNLGSATPASSQGGGISGTPTANWETVPVTNDPTNSQIEATHYFIGDHLGSAQMELAHGGWPIASKQYAPYGAELNSENGLNRYKFTGKERDTESGNDYFMARYYSSAMGRFMSPDWAAQEEPVPYAELDDPQSLNLYAYVRNNPLTRVDEDGHAPMSWGGFQNCASNNSNDDCQRQHNAEAGYGQMTDAELSKREGEQRQWLINNATSDASKDLASKADGPTVFHLYMCVNFGDCGKTSYDSSIIQLVNSPGVKAAVQAAATVLTGLPSGAIKLRGNQGFRDEDGNIWKKDQLHKDHWDVSDKNGKKIKEVDFNGRQIWPDGPKNKNK